MYGFPATYPGNTQYSGQQYPSYPTQPTQNQGNNMQTPTQGQSFSFGGLFRVPTYTDVERADINPGTIIFFVSTDGSYIYTKELGLSPMDRPIIRSFQHIEEQREPKVTAPHTVQDLSGYAQKTELEDLKLEIAVLREQLENFRKGDTNEK